MLVASQRFLLRAVQWTLRRLPQPIDTMAATEQLGAAVAALGDLPSSLIGEAESTALNERAAAFEALGAPPDIARRASALETLAAAGDLMLAARANGCNIEDAARLYFQLGERLSLARLRSRAHKLPRDGQWPSQAAVAMLDELAALHADLLGSRAQTAGRHGYRAAALERGPQARARAGRSPEGGAGGGGADRPRHAVGRDQRVARACLSRDHCHIGITNRRPS